MSIGRIPSKDPEAISARANFAQAQEEFRTSGLKSLGSVRKVQRAHEEMVKAEKLGHAREDAKTQEAERMKAEIWSIKTILCVLALVACLLALFDMPSDFYKVLRFSVVAACVAVIWDVQKGKASEQRKTIVSVVFGLLAVIFNPILPLEMERATWWWFDVGAGVGFAFYLHFSNPECIKRALNKLKGAFDPPSRKVSSLRFFQAGFNDEEFIAKQLSAGCYREKSHFPFTHPKVLRATWSMNFVNWITGSDEVGDALERSRQFRIRAFGEAIDEDTFFSALKEAVNCSSEGRICIGNISLNLPNP